VPRSELVGTTLKARETHHGPDREVGDNSRSRGRQHDTRAYTHSGRSGRRHRGRGRKRRPRSTGRPLKDPFRTFAERHLAEIAPFRSQETVIEKRRKLRQLERIVDELHAQGIIPSTNPKRFDAATVAALLKWFETHGWAVTYRAQFLNHLNGLLRHVGNAAIDNLRQRGLLNLDPGPQPIVPKDEAWLRDALHKLEPLEGWTAEVVRFAVQMYYGTGLRPKELRLAKYRDLDTQTWWMKVSAPKGLGRWTAGGDRILITDDVRPAVLDFLDRRERHLHSLGINPEAVEPLVPNVDGHYYTGPGWNRARYVTFRKAGIVGDYRILRPSFAKQMKSMGVGIESVSRMLRHTSVTTTEKFYARMEAADAWSEAASRKAARKNRLIID